MNRTTVRLVSCLAAAVLMPVTVVAASTAVQAGDRIDEPSYDFDCDGIRDPLETNPFAIVDGVESAGEVTIRYSTTDQLDVISQATPGISGGPEKDDMFGESLTSYDANDDGCDDLVVAASHEDVVDNGGTNRRSAGMVWTIHGSPYGLNPFDSEGVHLDSPGVPGSVGVDHGFGSSVRADSSGTVPVLAVAAVGVDDGAGAVYIRRGGSFHRLTQDTAGVSGEAEYGDRFGSEISVTDRYLAVGVPGEDLGEEMDAGMAHVFAFSTVGEAPRQRGAFHQDTTGISGSAETNDSFGTSVSVVSYRPTSDSPVIPLVSAGAPEEVVSGTENAGMAHLVTIPATNRYRQIASVHQASTGVIGTPETNDFFGYETVLAVRGTTSAGTPGNTSWVVAAKESEYDGQDDNPMVQVFGVSGSPGTGDKVVQDEDYGVDLFGWTRLDASGDYLYVGRPEVSARVYGVPWSNLFDGGNEPAVVHMIYRYE